MWVLVNTGERVCVCVQPSCGGAYGWFCSGPVCSLWAPHWTVWKSRAPSPAALPSPKRNSWTESSNTLSSSTESLKNRALCLWVTATLKWLFDLHHMVKTSVDALALQPLTSIDSAQRSKLFMVVVVFKYFSEMWIQQPEAKAAIPATRIVLSSPCPKIRRGLNSFSRQMAHWGLFSEELLLFSLIYIYSKCSFSSRPTANRCSIDASGIASPFPCFAHVF